MITEVTGPTASPRRDRVPGQVRRAGYAGTVQMPRATEGESFVPGRDGTTGEFVTIRRRTAGGVEFNGRLTSFAGWQPAEGHWPDVPILNLWWRSWNYAVALPPPPTRSRLTYRFSVRARVAAEREHGEAHFMTAVALGEEPNFNIGSTIDIDTFAGWPLMADLTLPSAETDGSTYNGNYGVVTGRMGVQRSLLVAAGASPAIGVVLSVFGVIGDLVNHEAECNFRFLTDSLILPEDENGFEGRLMFHYAPILVNAPE